ncbi:MAG: hypothetical protein FWF80_05795 [Defluviitaleaceae bacterium]|nr:hypothetical protein [Defluviitaleaceae bacterium]
MTDQKGSAYILVIVAAFVALSLVLTVLTVTATSRNITARYADFYGLYDVALAGNERAFHELEIALGNRADENDIVFENFVSSEACWHRHAPACLRRWRYVWTLGVNFGDSRSDFFATTTICERERDEVFYIETRVQKNAPDAPVTVVRKSANLLDCNTLVMLELFRVAY